MNATIKVNSTDRLFAGGTIGVETPMQISWYRKLWNKLFRLPHPTYDTLYTIVSVTNNTITIEEK